MRTTVDLPPAVHRRARELATARHTSLSAVLSDLVTRGLAQSEGPLELANDQRTGLPVLRLGRAIDAEYVAALIDEDTA